MLFRPSIRRCRYVLVVLLGLAAGTLRGTDAAWPLPAPTLRHLQTLTDNTGLHEFAHGTVPWHENGYCAEDVARALVAVTLYEQATVQTNGRALAHIYLRYLQHSLRADGTIWNRPDHMVANGDSYGRILWGLGTAASFQSDPECRALAETLLERLLPGWKSNLGVWPMPRAYAIQGLADYLRRHANEAARSALIECANANLALFAAHQHKDWSWFAEQVTYDPGRLPLSLLAAFEITHDPRYRTAGLASLDFLLTHCYDPAGQQLSPVGNQGWFKRGSAPAAFDQQPIDAASLVEACTSAARISGNKMYAARARTALAWFLGNNRAHLPLYDPQSGGCHDGLSATGVSENEGGESTVMYVIARCVVEETK